MDRIAMLKEMLKEDEKDPFLQHALALELIKTGNDKEARKLFETLLDHDPGYIGSYYHLGKLLEREGLPQKAIHIYQKGMEMSKAVNDSHSYNELKAAYEDTEDQ